jgi:hypothetical protein
MVELADNGPLYNCPKALDRVRVRRAINGSEEIALGIDSRVVDAAMCHELVNPHSPNEAGFLSAFGPVL